MTDLRFKALEDTVITQETAARIAFAYSEIKAAEALLEVLNKADQDRKEPDFRDVFGRTHRGLQLGVPSGDSGHRIMDVSPLLGKAVIRAHVAEKRKLIAELCEVAKIELAGTE